MPQILNGEEFTLDGNSQELTFSGEIANAGFPSLLTCYVTVLGAGGCRIGNETIDIAKHRLFPQNEKVPISILPGKASLWVRGTNNEKIVVTY